MSIAAIDENYPLILASASPRRKRLLGQVGLYFKAVPGNIDENLAELEGDPVAKACLLAEKKAGAVLPMFKNNWILGADTIVVIDKIILGKPKDHEDAFYMLDMLSGKKHSVITGFAIIDPMGRLIHSEGVITLVKIKGLSKKEITAYIATDEPFGKAGGYAIQGIGSFMVETISGSYTNVVGLPVCSLIKALLSTGAVKNFPFSSGTL